MKSEKQLKREYYDQFNRDKDSIKFYHGNLWLRVKKIKLSRNPLCETCEQENKIVKAQVVHHIIPIKKGTHSLDLDFLVSLCHACHNAVESEVEKDNASV